MTHFINWSEKVSQVKGQSPNTPWRKEKGSWRDEEGNIVDGIWPENQGFESNGDNVCAKVVRVPVGKIFDRWGGWRETKNKERFFKKIIKILKKEPKEKKDTFRDMGYFMSLPGVPLDNRSMPETDHKIYSIYIVTKSFAATVGPAAAYYGCTGGALQILTSRPIEDLIKDGCLKCIHREFP